ncbi:MAG TPA: hypothetical protein VJJ79_00505 [Candidatus Nanoarchaeia archaeon]|nr:hypothetical protein [Candidatus Nanoarchaeia archaeon]
MRREEHDKIIEKGIAVNQKLLDSPTLETITQIEDMLSALRARTGREYVIAFVGQPYGGPKRPMAIPKEDIEAAHHAYGGNLLGISPEIGRCYDLQAARERYQEGNVAFNPDHYPSRFIDFLRRHFDKEKYV